LTRFTLYIQKEPVYVARHRQVAATGAAIDFEPVGRRKVER
jgi:hypothetical protein